MLRFDIRWGMAMALMVLVMATYAQAERLFESDGIELSGTVRVVARGAGTCNILEASHTDAVYERMKVNHGQPLHVWRLDFSAYNGSGKPLSSLSAHFKIASEWPPCTNWSDPAGTYAKPVLWGGSFQVLQQPYGMEPGEEVSDTIFLLAFHEHQPEFESWDVDFRFGEAARAPEGSGDAAPPESSPEPPPQSVAPTPSQPPGIAWIRAGGSVVFDEMEFVGVPAGEFLMGSTSELAFTSEQPLTRVRISEGFYLGKYEVAQAEWEAVMGSNPSNYSGCGRCPVERVSWDDVQAFIAKLNARGESRYRLPTEAEWEYAARAGTSGDRYAANLDAIAWYVENSGNSTHPVGQKVPNAFGLYDMLGNIGEWVQDRHGDYPGGAVTDPTGPSTGLLRVCRGGGWVVGGNTYRSADRIPYRPDSHEVVTGFRLLRTAR